MVYTSCLSLKLLCGCFAIFNDTVLRQKTLQKQSVTTPTGGLTEVI